MTEIDTLGTWVPTETDDIKDSELWSLDATLTDFILPRIKAFRKMERHGYPRMSGYPVLGKDIKTNIGQLNSEKERAAAEWENILFDIEKGFETHKKMTEESRDLPDGTGNALANAAPIWGEEIMRKGLRLFAEHYDHLWN